MRVIGGKFRHRLLTWPEDQVHIRPTKDRIREAIFNALNDCTNYKVLDLYAGSGAMGIEALSRNAQHSTFVDISKIALKTIKENLISLKIESSSYHIVAEKDIEALSNFTKNKEVFDLVILDPPYKEGKYIEILNIIMNNDLLSTNGIIVMESDHSLELNFSSFKKVKEYKYGEIFVTILWR